MTEKETFIATHHRECEITHRLISAFPAGALDFRPAERSRSAKELAFTLANHELIFSQAVQGVFDPSIFGAPAPATLAQIVHLLEKNHNLIDATVEAAPDADLNQIMNFAGYDMRRMDVLWANLFDIVHHRGQFSVYVRMAGGKVPSIYGPSADDPGTHSVAGA
jgi:uncharacterized damage-inducible protein DinB